MYLNLSIFPLFTGRVMTLACFAVLMTSLCGFSSEIEAPSDEEAFIAQEACDELQTEVALSYWEACVLGVVEGLTEYLPVSSTGHLILADRFLDGETSSPEAREARNAYLIVIQGGAILAVIFLYWRKLLSIMLGLIGRDPAGLQLGLKILVAFVPAALVGPFLNDWIEVRLFNPGAVSVALVVGAIVMIIVEKSRRRARVGGTGAVAASEDSDEGSGLEGLSFREAFFIGVMQCLAMWPGMSRSMVTIVGGYLVGLSARSAAEFSFLLGLLTLSAASAYSLLGSWQSLSNHLAIGPAVLGIAVATVVAFLAVKWFVVFLSRYGLVWFAYYRLVIALLIVIVLRSV